MTYSHGMQSFPAVGGGLGGLPRRIGDSVMPTPSDPYFSNVSLLLCGNGYENSKIIVDSSKLANTVSVLNNARIVTSLKKYGTGSLAFGGVSDYLNCPTVLDIPSNTDSTLECWFNLTSWDDNVGIFGWANSFGLAAYSSELKFWGKSIISIISAAETTALLGTWVHFALVYVTSTNTKKIYINGISKHSSSDSLALSSAGGFDVGRFQYQSGYYKYLNGYVDDLRITKGVARYTENFTPPTEQFPDR